MIYHQQNNQARLAEIAKRNINAMLRAGARGDVLAAAWQALAEIMRERRAS